MWVLGALSAFGPLSIDMYLPALPSMARSLDAAPSLTQLTLSLALIGLGIGQVFAGPISDAVGRRRPMWAGLCAYVVASGICAAVPSIALLLVMRLIQGVAGAFGIAIARAVVRDRSEGIAAARAYAALMLVGGLGPIVAPIMGGLLLHVTDWRGIFVTLGLVGALVLALALLWVPESLPRERRDQAGLAGVRQAMGLLLRDGRYLAHTLCGALAFGTLMAYISAAPFVLERIHGLSPQQFSLVFAGNGAGLLVARQISSSLLSSRSPSLILRGALAIQVTAAIGLLAVVLAGGGLALLLICLFLAASSFGAVTPMATVLAMQDHPQRAGSASGIFGCSQFLLGAGVAPLAGVAGSHSALPLAILMPSCSLCAAVVLRLDRHRGPGVAVPSAAGEREGLG